MPNHNIRIKLYPDYLPSVKPLDTNNPPSDNDLILTKMEIEGMNDFVICYNDYYAFGYQTEQNRPSRRGYIMFPKSGKGCYNIRSISPWHATDENLHTKPHIKISGKSILSGHNLLDLNIIARKVCAITLANLHEFMMAECRHMVLDQDTYAQYRKLSMNAPNIL